MASKEDIAPQVRISAGKDAVVEAMVGGCSFAGACRQAGYAKSTVYGWRGDDVAFDRTIRGLIEAQGDKGWQSEVDPSEMGWKQKFIACFERTQNRTESLRKSGALIAELRDALDAESPDFDREFAERYAEVWQKRQWEVEDQRYQLAKGGKVSMIQDMLNPRDGQGQGSGGTINVNVFGNDGFEFAQGFLSQRFGSEPAEDFGRLRGTAPRQIEDVSEGEVGAGSPHGDG